ncbi:MAG: AmmeMemoRadiSam system protein B [bacterium]|nr:AmmeMemoRadiSam system protein B [bacterium]
MTMPQGLGAEILPRLRAEIQIDVHREDGQDFLILSDTFGIAEGPIMIGADMVDVLEACDGVTTIAEIAAASNVEPDGPEMTRLMIFLGQLTEMGYMEGIYAETRARNAIEEFVSATIRQPVCAGNTYSADPDELHKQLDDMLNLVSTYETAGASNADTSDADSSANKALSSTTRCVIIPHIDFRVAPEMYGPCFNAIRNSTAELVVMIGTSHYWGQHRFILTEKDFATPIGTVKNDKSLVSELRDELAAIDARYPGEPHPLLAPNDLAHKPEHSLELHAVFLQHLWGAELDADGNEVEGSGRPFTILPILVSGIQDYFSVEGAPSAKGPLHDAIEAIRDVVAESGKEALWLVSGDLSHFGTRFGDETPALDMMASVREADSELLRHLAAGNADAFYNAVRDAGDAYRICGLAPAYVALEALKPGAGEVVAYDMWDDSETGSAVSFAGIAYR